MLGELRRMVDRSSQRGWRCFISAAQQNCRGQITGEIHGEISNDHGTKVSGAGTVRTGSLVVTRSGLRCLQIAMLLAHVTDDIGDEIAGKKQQGKERENAQESFVMQLHQCRTDKRTLCQVNQRPRAQCFRAGGT